MVLTKDELIASLQNEVRILLHLASKLDPTMLDYRPTPKQRTPLELLRYLAVMGPSLIRGAKIGAFDMEFWQSETEKANAASVERVLEMIAAQSAEYERLLNQFSDADFRAEIEMFGRKQSRGSFIVNLVLSGCAAYRTQLFLYLKSCGREELSTMNLWGGIDAPAPAAQTV